MQPNTRGNSVAHSTSPTMRPTWICTYVQVDSKYLCFFLSVLVGISLQLNKAGEHGNAGCLFREESEKIYTREMGVGADDSQTRRTPRSARLPWEHHDDARNLYLERERERHLMTAEDREAKTYTPVLVHHHKYSSSASLSAKNISSTSGDGFKHSPVTRARQRHKKRAPVAAKCQKSREKGAVCVRGGGMCAILK